MVSGRSRSRTDADGQRRSRKSATCERWSADTDCLAQVVGDAPRSNLAAIGDCDRELVTAVPAGHRIGREAPADNVPDRTHAFGTSKVSILVVQRLEVVDIGHEERERRSSLPDGPDHSCQTGFERTQVVKAGQIVGH